MTGLAKDKEKKETPAQKRARIAKKRKASDALRAKQKIEICARISTGETMRAISRSEGMPHWNTVYNWMSADEEFAVRIARARELGYDANADDCLEIADDSSEDYLETESGERLNSEHVQRSKLRIDTRLKLLAKWSPGKYGEKIDVTSGNKPIKNEWHLHPVTANKNGDN